jgi:serine/threonine protein kinase
MELVKGCDLLSRIRANEPRVKNNMPFYLAEVLCAIEHLHKNLIVYRDLKPEHVMIGQDGHC